MMLENGLKITKEGFRSVDPATYKTDEEIWTKGRINPKTGKFVKPVLIEKDSLVMFKDMPKEAYDIMSKNDAFIVDLYRRGKFPPSNFMTMSGFMKYIKRNGNIKEIK